MPAGVSAAAGAGGWCGQGRRRARPRRGAPGTGTRFPSACAPSERKKII